MADRKISDLTALTTPAAGDYLPIIDISEPLAANKNKRITIEELLRGAPDGTAAAPSFAFESDGGNGFYLASTDTIGASTNGVNRLTLSTSALTSTVPISATSFAPTSSTVPTNGLYLPAANSVALSTNGTGRLFVDASGNVGVGTGSVTGTNTRLEVSNDSAEIKVSSTSAFNTNFRGFTIGITGDSTNYSGIRFQPNSGELRTEAGFATWGGFQTFYTNGLERLRITPAGLVGVGTSSPSGLLHVAGQIYSSGTGYTGTNSPTLRLINSTATTGRTFGINSADSGGLQVFDASAGDATRLWLDSSGRVGIGTTDPGAKLHIEAQSNGNFEALRLKNTHGSGSSQGSVDINLDIVNSVAGVARARIRASEATSDSNLSTLGFFTSHNTSTEPTERLNIGSSGTLTLTSESATAPFIAKISTTEVARIDSAGRLLVGTSSARTKWFNLTLTGPLIQAESGSNQMGVSSTYTANDASGPIIALGKTRGSLYEVVSSGDDAGVITFQGGDGSEMVEAARITAQIDGTPGANDMPGRLVFSTTADGASSPTERMRISSNGLVAFEQDYSGKYAQRINSSSTSSTQFFIQFARGGTECGYILSGGANSTTYSTSSDYRLKENLVPLPNAIDRTKQLKVYRFNFIEEPERTIDGFVAHEVQTIVPEAIVGEKDEVYEDGRIKPQGIDQSKLVPLLTAALQEAIAKIESLEARLTAAGI